MLHPVLVFVLPGPLCAASKRNAMQMLKFTGKINFHLSAEWMSEAPGRGVELLYLPSSQYTHSYLLLRQSETSRSTARLVSPEPGIKFTDRITSPIKMGVTILSSRSIDVRFDCYPLGVCVWMCVCVWSVLFFFLFPTRTP